MEFALLRRFGNATEALFAGPDGLREHAFDALAAIVACLESDVVRALRPRADGPLARAPGNSHQDPDRHDGRVLVAGCVGEGGPHLKIDPGEASPKTEWKFTMRREVVTCK